MGLGLGLGLGNRHMTGRREDLPQGNTKETEISERRTKTNWLPINRNREIGKQGQICSLQADTDPPMCIPGPGGSKQIIKPQMLLFSADFFESQIKATEGDLDT